MHIYVMNNPAKFHPDPIRNDRALGFFEDDLPNNKDDLKIHNNKMFSDMGSPCFSSSQKFIRCWLIWSRLTADKYR